MMDEASVVEYYKQRGIVKTMTDADSGRACWYNASNDWAFGPIFASRQDADETLMLLLERYVDPLDCYDSEIFSAYFEVLKRRRQRKGSAESG